MLATLCSYESRFGPYHPQTLCMMTHLGAAYWQAGEPRRARPLLERAVRDLGRHLGESHDLRLSALTTLRDLFVAQGDYQRAASIQKELLECQTQRLGRDHPETQVTRAKLANILLENVSDPAV
jgi:eukaryotic-like serine/threonine-protein kinase